MENANAETFEQLVAVIVECGLAKVNTSVLGRIANELWYSGHVPDLGLVPPELRGDAGYLIERLTRFNILDQEREAEILVALAPWQDQIEQESAPHCRDPLAHEWGASADLRTGALIALLLRSSEAHRSSPKYR
ncbi:MAG: hypothetical protein WAV95_10390 [Azonexus sp.]